jgi:hypothetical protein
MDLLWHDSAGTFLDDTMNGATGGSAPFANGAVGTQWHGTAVGGSFATGDTILLDDAAGNPPTGDMNGIGIAGMSALGFMGSQQQFGGSSANSDLAWADPGSAVQFWHMNDGGIGQAATPIGLGGTEWSLEAVNDLGGNGLLWQPNGSQVQPPLFAASAIGGTEWTLAAPQPSGIVWSGVDLGGPSALGGAPQSTFNMPAGSNPQPMLGNPFPTGGAPQTPVNMVPGNAWTGVASLPQGIVYGAGVASPPQGIVYGTDPATLNHPFALG